MIDSSGIASFNMGALRSSMQVSFLVNIMLTTNT